MTGRHQIIDDHEFWSRLEYAATDWLFTSSESNLRRFWIDGFDPMSVVNTKRGLDVEGVAWVHDGNRTGDEFRFLVSVPQKTLHKRRGSFQIDSLSLDEERRFLGVVVAACNETIRNGL